MRLLKDAVRDGVVEVALHGYSHEFLVAVADPPGRRSEFAWLSERVQNYRINKGKELLEKWLDCEIQTFIPPWNSYDDTTLGVLSEAGFRVLSAGKSSPQGEAGLVYLHANAASLRQVRNAVHRATGRKGRTVVVVCLHHYNFSHDGARLDDLDALLTHLESVPDVEVLSLRQCAEKYGAQRITSSKLTWYDTVYSWVDMVERWAKPSPLVCGRLGVAPPLLLSLVIASFAQALGRGRVTSLMRVRTKHIHMAVSVLAFMSMVILAIVFFNKYERLGFKGEFFLLMMSVFALDSTRRVWLLGGRAEARGRVRKMV